MLAASHLDRSLCCFPAQLQCHRVRPVLPGISPGDSCWPPFNLLSLLLQCRTSKSHHAPAQQAEQQHVSAIHPLLPRTFGEVTGCQPISLQPSWEISLHSGESHREMAFVFLCYGLAVVFNHDFFPASPRTFGFANLLPFSSQHYLMVIGFHFSQILPFDAS